jgi:hypothetical protein
VAIFTASDFSATEEELLSYGVAGILRKPFLLKELLKLLGIVESGVKHG